MDLTDTLRRLIRLFIICFITYLIAKNYLNIELENVFYVVIGNAILFMFIDTIFPRIHYEYK